MSYGLVIFDFDGTLADSFAWFLSTWNRIAPARGLQAMDPATLEAYRGLSASELVRALDVPLLKVPALMTAMRREMSRNLAQVQLFAGAGDLLADLRRHGVRSAIVSSNSQANVEQILGRKYASMIDHFACGASLLGKRRKFREVLKAIDVPPAKALCVGDELRDADAAASAGLDFIGVGWGFATAEALAKGSRLPPVDSFDALLERVLGASPA
jgi:phosphoglycolate phosphatase